jgi:hypothetical protein
LVGGGMDSLRVVIGPSQGSEAATAATTASQQSVSGAQRSNSRMSSRSGTLGAKTLSSGAMSLAVAGSPTSYATSQHERLRSVAEGFESSSASEPSAVAAQAVPEPA